MGQNHSLSEALPNLDEVHMQMIRHTKVLTEINSLTYEEFKNCLDNLNSLSRKCIDKNGKQLVFLVKNGTDATLLWKAIVKIACIKVDPNTKKMETYKLLNLKQFLCVCRTFQSHLETLITSEMQNNQKQNSIISIEDDNNGYRNGYDNDANHIAQQSNQSSIRSPTEIIFKDSTNFSNNLNSPTTSSSPSSLPSSSSTTTTLSRTICLHLNDHIDECSICLERNTEVILPCTHSFCIPCIEQWNVSKKICPICSENLNSMDETWIMSNLPAIEEINEKICTEFMNLVK